MKTALRATFSGLAALVLIPLVAPAAHAAPGAELRWAVTPSGPTGPTGRAAFDYEAAPGQQIADTVAISNLSDEAINFTVYSTDAYTAADGAFALLPADNQPHDIGSWTDLTPHAYVVSPKKRIDIPFHLTVPANATPGDHAGGIIASVAQLQNTPQGQQVYVDRRIAARIYLRVAGPVHPGLRVESAVVDYPSPALPFGTAAMTVTYRLKNSGNIRVHGTAKVRARGPFGIQLGGSDEVTVPELLPGAEITLTKKVPGVLSLGRLTASVTVNPESKEGRLPVASRSATVWASPWGLVGVLLIVAALIASFIVLRRRRRLIRAG